MKRAGRFVLFSLTFVALFAPAAAHANAPDTVPPPLVPVGGSFAPLTACAGTQHSLSVLFLIDTSQSLKETDPSGERVSGIEAALSSLGTLMRTSQDGATPFSVYADFLEFGSATRRSFPNLPEWGPVGTDTSALQAAALDYANRNNSEDTDYVAALEPWRDRDDPTRPADEIGALELLERAPAGSCRLLVWFTDGQLDIDFQRQAKTLHWADEAIPIASNNDEPAAELRAIDALCKPGGAADAARGSGDMTNGAVFIAAVAFGDLDFDLVNAVATGTGRNGPCGASPGLGVFLQARDIDSLIEQLRQAVLGPSSGDNLAISTCLNTDPGLTAGASLACDFPFQIDESLTAFNLLTIAGDEAISASLITPTGEVLSLDGTNSSTAGNGAVLSIEELNSTVHLVEASLPAGRLDWSGIWRVRYQTSDPAKAASILNRASIYVFGSLAVKLRPAAALLRTREGTFTVELTAVTGEPKSDLAYAAGSELLVTVNGTEVLATPAANPDGSFQFAYTVPAGYSADTIRVSAKLTPRVQVAADAPVIELPVWESDLGTIEVKDVPSYPLVDQPGVLGALDKDHLTRSTTLHVDASAAPEAGGCVTLESLEVTDLPDGMTGSPEVVVTNGGIEITVGDECAVSLVAGEQLDLVLQVTVTTKQLRAKDGLIRGTMTFKSTSTKDPSQSGEFPFEFASKVLPNYVVIHDTGSAVGLGILAAALPLLFLWLYGYFVGAKMEVTNVLRSSIPVVFTNGHLERVNDNGSRSRFKLTEDDLNLTGLDDGRERRVTVGAVTWRAHAPISPVGDAKGRVDAPGRALVVSRQGTTRGKLRGRTPLSVMNNWAFHADQQDLIAARDASVAASADSDAQIGELAGEVVMLLPAPSRLALESSDSMRAEMENVLPAAIQMAISHMPPVPAPRSSEENPPEPGQGEVDGLPGGTSGTKGVTDLPDMTSGGRLSRLPGEPDEIEYVDPIPAKSKGGISRLFSGRSKSKADVDGSLTAAGDSDDDGLPKW